MNTTALIQLSPEYLDELEYILSDLGSVDIPIEELQEVQDHLLAAIGLASSSDPHMPQAVSISMDLTTCISAALPLPPEDVYLISPDGFAFNPNGEPTTIEEVKRWYKDQGYYSANSGRIPLDELEGRCIRSDVPYVDPETVLEQATKNRFSGSTPPSTALQDIVNWMDDGNVVRTGPDSYKEQSTQWRKTFTLVELVTFYAKEFGATDQ